MNSQEQPTSISGLVAAAEMNPPTQANCGAKPLAGELAAGAVDSSQPLEMRAIVSELRGIQAALEANLRAIALVRVSNLLRRLDESPHEGPQ